MGKALLGLGKGGAGVADWDGNELHLFPYMFEGGDEGGVLGGLVVKLGWQPKSLQKPISMSMRLHFLRSKVFRSGFGVLGTPLA